MLVLSLFAGLLGCSGTTQAPFDSDPDTETSSETDGGTSADMSVLFSDTFEVENPGDVLESVGLPAELFPQDGSRWSNLQNTHPDENTASWKDGWIQLDALGRPDPEASKVGLVKERFAFYEGDTVMMSARMKFDGSVVSAPHTTTLFDLEDTDDLLLDGNGTGAGLRVWLDSQGYLGLDRGELLPTDNDADRMRGLSSTTPLPIDQWVEIEIQIKLGTGLEDSTMVPIDTSFDKSTTAGWCEIWVTPEGGARTLVLRQHGVTFLDRALGLARLAEIAPDIHVEWSKTLSFDSFQVGLTNNRSTVDQRLQLSSVQVAIPQ